MLGKKNYGEYLLHKFKDSLPENWLRELEPLTRPSFPGARPFLLHHCAVYSSHGNFFETPDQSQRICRLR